MKNNFLYQLNIHHLFMIHLLIFYSSQQISFNFTSCLFHKCLKTFWIQESIKHSFKQDFFLFFFVKIRHLTKLISWKLCLYCKIFYVCVNYNYYSFICLNYNCAKNVHKMANSAMENVDSTCGHDGIWIDNFNSFAFLCYEVAAERHYSPNSSLVYWRDVCPDGSSNYSLGNHSTFSALQ